MKNRLLLGSLFAALCLATSVPSLAQTAAAPPPPAEAPRELAIVVIDSLNTNRGGMSDFNLIAMVFTKVFKQRNWPVHITTERFAANTPNHDTELRVFFKSINEESLGELTFRAWVTLSDHGQKHDFGIVLYRFYPRPLQNSMDVLEEATRGAAEIVATKIEAILFPKPAKPKP